MESLLVRRSSIGKLSHDPTAVWILAVSEQRPCRRKQHFRLVGGSRKAPVFATSDEPEYSYGTGTFNQDLW